MTVHLRRCTNCLMPATRPRLTFNEKGVCSACQWAVEKQSLNWAERWAELQKLCDECRSSSGHFDCIVPVSGGKDSSYVSYQMKHILGMHPLCVNIVPPHPNEIINRCLENFNNAGYDLLMVAPNPRVAKRIARRNLIEFGQPLLSWMTAVQVAVFKLGVKLNIPLIMFGEEGETEYGGVGRFKKKPTFDVEEGISIYLSGSDPKRYADEFSPQDLYWWLFPEAEEVRAANLRVAHWSYFENWDPYRNYLIAKEHCGLEERPSASIGTFTNYASTDTPMFDLHTYLMYLKFGFGRATHDVGVEIRRGAMTRKQAVELVKLFDGQYPEQYFDLYCEYHEMTPEEFQASLDKWANKQLFKKENGRWVAQFDVV